MKSCNDIRGVLALHAGSADSDVQTHLSTCSDCAAYRQRHAALDGVLRSELRWQAPAALTAQLLALTAAPLLYAAPRPKTWYVRLVYVLTLLAISCSVLIGWHVAAMLVAQFGLSETLAWLWAAPADGLHRLTATLPQASYAIELFLRVRDQLLWLLFAAVLWAALDRRGARGAKSLSH